MLYNDIRRINTMLNQTFTTVVTLLHTLVRHQTLSTSHYVLFLSHGVLLLQLPLKAEPYKLCQNKSSLHEISFFSHSVFTVYPTNLWHNWLLYKWPLFQENQENNRKIIIIIIVWYYQPITHKPLEFALIKREGWILALLDNRHQTETNTG